MNGIRRIVLDILKPHEPKITDMALKLTSLSNIDGVNITVYEIDKETENVKVTIEGNNLDFDEIQEIIESLGGTIHSIDEVVAGARSPGQNERRNRNNERRKKIPRRRNTAATSSAGSLAYHGEEEVIGAGGAKPLQVAGTLNPVEGAERRGTAGP